MPQSPPLAAKSLLPILGILLIATNLRLPITGVAPLLGMIQDSFGLSAAAAGVLTTAPLLVFAAVSPLSPLLARNIGLERALFAALVLIILGIAARSSGFVWPLYLGTSLIGVGIAICNVLLPSLLKRDFPDHLALLTSSYALTMGAAAALGSAAAVPLAQLSGLGWPLALGASGLFALASALAWLPQLRRRPVITTAARNAAPKGMPIWRYALAWYVTLFLGINSFVYYIVISWLPTILSDADYSSARAGTLHGLLQFASAVAGLIMIPIMRRIKDQRVIALGTSLASIVGILGLLLVPQWAGAWSLLFGFGCGAAFILALTFIGLRVATPGQAAALSGMAQCLGYLLAAGGPTLVGKLYDLTGNWTLGLMSCVLALIIMSVLGVLAGGSRQIGQETAP